MSGSLDPRFPAGFEAPTEMPAVLLCMGCRKRGSCHLGVTLEEVVGDELVAQLACPEVFEGGPTVAHGGWTAAAFDEVLGHAPFALLRIFAVTAHLEVDYVKPVPVAAAVEIRARVDSVEPRRAHISGEMTLVSSGVVLGRARGQWASRDWRRHFTDHWSSLDEGGQPRGPAGPAGSLD